MKFYTTEQIIDNDLDELFIKIDELIDYLTQESISLSQVVEECFKPKNIEIINNVKLEKVSQMVNLCRGRLSMLDDLIREVYKNGNDVRGPNRNPE